MNWYRYNAEEASEDWSFLDYQEFSYKTLLAAFSLNTVHIFSRNTFQVLVL